jgi:hypothetical protein
MTTASDWPPYSIGPRESLFVIGIISTKYVELESVTEFIFCTVFDLGLDAGRIIFSKTGCLAATDLIASRLKQLDWPETTIEHVAHFVSAIKINNSNRNHLMHSELMFDNFREADVASVKTDKSVFFKASNSGRIIATALTLEELRRLADDINAFCEYGRQLGNAINSAKFNGSTFPASFFPWPNKPSLPRDLKQGYTSDRISL